MALFTETLSLVVHKIWSLSTDKSTINGWQVSKENNFNSNLEVNHLLQWNTFM